MMFNWFKKQPTLKIRELRKRGDVLRAKELRRKQKMVERAFRQIGLRPVVLINPEHGGYCYIVIEQKNTTSLVLECSTFPKGPGWYVPFVGEVGSPGCHKIIHDIGDLADYCESRAR
jgi:hypothetical protein